MIYMNSRTLLRRSHEQSSLEVQMRDGSFVRFWHQTGVDVSATLLLVSMEVNNVCNYVDLIFVVIWD